MRLALRLVSRYQINGANKALSLICIQFVIIRKTNDSFRFIPRYSLARPLSSLSILSSHLDGSRNLFAFAFFPHLTNHINALNCSVDSLDPCTLFRSNEGHLFLVLSPKLDSNPVVVDGSETSLI
jgi:hypothetical protein